MKSPGDRRDCKFFVVCEYRLTLGSIVDQPGKIKCWTQGLSITEDTTSRSSSS